MENIGHGVVAGLEGEWGFVKGFVKGLGSRLWQWVSHPLDTVWGMVKMPFEASRKIGEFIGTFSVDPDKALNDLRTGLNDKLNAIASASTEDWGGMFGATWADVLVFKGLEKVKPSVAEPTPSVPPEPPPEVVPTTNGAGKPQFLLRIEKGNNFNEAQRLFYEYNEVFVEKPAGSTGGKYFKLDSYNPTTGEIVSRKLTQFWDISEEAGIKYVNELKRKYPSGTKIADVPTSGSLAGERLAGQMFLEVPVQSNPIPQAVIDAANKAKVIIRDVTGHRYN